MIIYLLYPSPIAGTIIGFFDIMCFAGLLLYFQSFFYCIVYGTIIHLLVFSSLLQWSLIKQRGAIMLGMSLALISSQLLAYNLYVIPYSSPSISLALILPIAFSYIQLALSFHITKPQHLKSLSSAELARQIIAAAPTEGPQTMAIDDQLDQIKGELYDLKKKTPRICTVCMVDKRLASTHCKYCDLCVIGLDHHDLPLNNCVGKGELSDLIKLKCMLLIF
jgi:hypothetical protein